MGLKTPIKSKADSLLNESLGKIVDTLNTYISRNSSEERTSIYELMTDSEQFRPEISYFWEWMRENGFSLLQDLDKRLPESDEVLELLEYRKMVLEMDASGDSIDMFLLSITEFLTTVSEFLAAYFESAAATMEFHTHESLTLPAKRMVAIKNEWDTMKSSAPRGAELLLYFFKEMVTWIDNKRYKILSFPRPQSR